MTIFDGLSLLGGLCLFLFGMTLMGEALERFAGGSLQKILAKLTTGRIAGLLTGLGVTSIIQSSSATTVMVVGFVNSGLMSLRQAINVIMGANIGTTVTAWILSLGGIDGESLFLKLLKPTSFTPVLALVGTVLYMFSKSKKKKEIGTILLGFATLMFGMDAMTDAVSGLADVPEFQNLFLLFKNPILGVLAGAILTAVIQSSSASVGILQALAATGQVSYGAAIPIIMGQNIGTCITAILSSFGTNKNAKRAAIVHLSFNVIGTTIFLSLYAVADAVVSPLIFDEAATLAGIATVHSLFNVCCTTVLLPCSGLLEKLANCLVPDAKTPEVVEELDRHLLATPAVALERTGVLAVEMAEDAAKSFTESLSLLSAYDSKKAKFILEMEEKTDHYEDIIGAYLVELSALQLDADQSAEAAKLLRIIGDYERIADFSVDIMRSAEEMRDKEITFSGNALEEIGVITRAASEMLELAKTAFAAKDLNAAKFAEPLEDRIDELKDQMRKKHIARLQQGQCSIDAGFIWSDVLTSLERASNHCANVASCMIDHSLDMAGIHESIRDLKKEELYAVKYEEYAIKYHL